MTRAAIGVVSDKGDYVFVGDGTDLGTEIRPASEEMHAALKAAVLALRGTAVDLGRIGAMRESNRALDQAALIEEAIK